MPHARFETAIGECSLEWGERGIASVDLPGGPPRPAASGERPPAAVATAIESIQALLAGDAVDLRGVGVDLRSAPDFDRRVYAAAREVGPGETITYGEIAVRIGTPGSAREVGEALGRNPVPVVVPCHRVVAAGGAAGGFSAPGGVGTKLRLLAIEAPHTPGTLPLFAA